MAAIVSGRTPPARPAASSRAKTARAARHFCARLHAESAPVNPKSDGRTEIVEGGSDRARYRKETMENVREMAVTHGTYTEEQFQDLMDCFDDPTFRYVDVLWIGVWGRRPER